MDCGEIFKVSDTYFVWKIPCFYNLEPEIAFLSPLFQYEGNTWYLRVFKNEDERLLTRFSLDRFIRSEDCTQTYKLCIKDTAGMNYWSSMCSNVFSNASLCGTEQKIHGTVLVKDMSRIAPDGVLSLHLLFFPSKKEAKIPGPRPNWTVTELDRPTNQWDKKHLTVLPYNFSDLLISKKNSDVTLKVRGIQFEVHKHVLKATSPVFNEMFNHGMVERNFVEVNDSNPETFYNFLMYLYTETLHEITEENVVELYIIADKYGVKTLTEVCVRFMICNLNVDSFCKIMKAAIKYCETELLESAKTFFVEHLDQIMATLDWDIFLIDHPAEGSELLIQALNEGQDIPLI